MAKVKKLNNPKSLVKRHAFEAQKGRIRNNWTLQREQDQSEARASNHIAASRFNYDDEREGLKRSRSARAEKAGKLAQ